MYTLKSFAKRPDDFASCTGHRDHDHHDDDLDDPLILPTASLLDVHDLHQEVHLVSSHRFVRQVPPGLLTGFLAVLIDPVKRAIKHISPFDQRNSSSQNGCAVCETVLGVLYTTKILSIISAQDAPRVLLVQEMIEDPA